MEYSLSHVFTTFSTLIQHWELSENYGAKKHSFCHSFKLNKIGKYRRHTQKIWDPIYSIEFRVQFRAFKLARMLSQMMVCDTVDSLVRLLRQYSRLDGLIIPIDGKSLIIMCFGWWCKWRLTSTDNSDRISVALNESIYPSITAKYYLLYIFSFTPNQHLSRHMAIVVKCHQKLKPFTWKNLLILTRLVITIKLDLIQILLKFFFLVQSMRRVKAYWVFILSHVARIYEWYGNVLIVLYKATEGSRLPTLYKMSLKMLI